MSERCSWCNSDAEEAAKHHEGPHLTWCPSFREEQRGGDHQSCPNCEGKGRVEKWPGIEPVIYRQCVYCKGTGK